MLEGAPLIHEVGKRILARYLAREGAAEVTLAPASIADQAGIDIRYVIGGERLAAKVKVDCYYGSDPALTARRELVYYRPEGAAYALEAVADTVTRAPGWVQTSGADVLFYYRIALARPEAEVAALQASADGVFFSELGVERDELRVVPMPTLRAWFAASGERYTPRPVTTAGHSAWCRIVPIADLDAAVPGVRVIGPVYRGLGVR